MRKLFLLIAFVAASFACAHAETILLRTGARVKGTIVFQNEEVVIVRDAAGKRFQYPKTDVENILSDDEVAEEQETVAEEAPEIKTTKKASILLEVADGAAVVPNADLGMGFSVDLLVGSHHIGDRHIFLGGGLGYHGIFLLNAKADATPAITEKYNFLPVQFALRMPFMETKHAPAFGFSAGYGVALSKDYIGGMYVGFDLGYRCQLNPKTAIGAVFFTQFQQAKVKTYDVIEGVTFENFTGRNILSFGAKFTLYL